MRKKRGYKRESLNLKRDYTLFAIACEGGKREPEYFRLLELLSNRISIDIIEDVVPDDEMASKYESKSAPKWVLDRAVRYIEKENLIKEDELWFVIDVDNWKTEQIREIAMYCEKYENWNIAISNPCFEVWLYYHKNTKIPTNINKKCKDLKLKLSKLTKGGYKKEDYIIEVKEAIINSKKNDNNKDYFLPKPGETKVYLLMESLLTRVSKREFNTFKELYIK